MGRLLGVAVSIGIAIALYWLAGQFVLMGARWWVSSPGMLQSVWMVAIIAMVLWGIGWGVGAHAERWKALKHTLEAQRAESEKAVNHLDAMRQKNRTMRARLAELTTEHETLCRQWGRLEGIEQTLSEQQCANRKTGNQLKRSQRDVRSLRHQLNDLKKKQAKA